MVKSVSAFRKDEHGPGGSFGELCVPRQVYTALRATAKASAPYAMRWANRASRFARIAAARYARYINYLTSGDKSMVAAKTLDRRKESPVKPRIFIASSVEGKDVADALQLAFHLEARCTVWHQAFPISGATIDTLIQNCTDNDFAIFVFSPDDILHMRKQQYEIARDNVLFEGGLFMGMRGRDRAFIVTPQGSPSFHIPSDLLGLTTATYDPSWAKTNPNPAVGAAATQIRQAIKKSSWSKTRIEIVTKTTIDPPATFPLKLHLTFTNKHGVALCLDGKDFTCSPGVPIAPNATTLAGGNAHQIRYFIGKNSAGVDIYQTKCVLEPGTSVTAWIAIDPAFGKAALDAAFHSQATGTLRYRAVWLNEPPSSEDMEEQF